VIKGLFVDLEQAYRRAPDLAANEVQPATLRRRLDRALSASGRRGIETVRGRAQDREWISVAARSMS
jgi:hypothetical protein